MISVRADEDYPPELQGDVYDEYARNPPLQRQRARDAGTQRPRDSEDTVGHTPHGECVPVSSVSSVSPTANTDAGDFLAAVMATVRTSPLPAASGRYHLDGIKLLVALCLELQRLAGERPFFLGCRDAGRLLGVPFQRAANWLRRLSHDRIIQLATKGSKASGRASEWRYIGGN